MILIWLDLGIHFKLKLHLSSFTTFGNILTRWKTIIQVLEKGNILFLQPIKWIGGVTILGQLYTYSSSVLSDAGAFCDSVIIHNILEFWNYLCFIISGKFNTFCNAFLKLTLDDLIITLRGERSEKYSPVNGSVIVMYNTCPTSYQWYWQSRTPLDTSCGLWEKEEVRLEGSFSFHGFVVYYVIA